MVSSNHSGFLFISRLLSGRLSTILCVASELPQVFCWYSSCLVPELTIFTGYHRVWAHSSYSTSTPLKIYLAAVGAGAVQGSIRWWSRDHRAHYRHTDTDKDPYSVRNGIMYSHLGWIILKQNPKRIGRTDISYLNDDAVVIW